MEIKPGNELGFEQRKNADFFKKVGEQAGVPGYDINNKQVQRTQQQASSLRPSDIGNRYEAQGTHVNIKV